MSSMMAGLGHGVAALTDALKSIQAMKMDVMLKQAQMQYAQTQYDKEQKQQDAREKMRFQREVVVSMLPALIREGVDISSLDLGEILPKGMSELDFSKLRSETGNATTGNKLAEILAPYSNKPGYSTLLQTLKSIGDNKVDPQMFRELLDSAGQENIARLTESRQSNILDKRTQANVDAARMNHLYKLAQEEIGRQMTGKYKNLSPEQQLENLEAMKNIVNEMPGNSLFSTEERDKAKKMLNDLRGRIVNSPTSVTPEDFNKTYRDVAGALGIQYQNVLSIPAGTPNSVPQNPWATEIKEPNLNLGQ